MVSLAPSTIGCLIMYVGKEKRVIMVATNNRPIVAQRCCVTTPPTVACCLRSQRLQCVIEATNDIVVSKWLSLVAFLPHIFCCHFFASASSCSSFRAPFSPPTFPTHFPRPFPLPPSTYKTRSPIFRISSMF